jgi:hypothetical protein
MDGLNEDDSFVQYNVRIYVEPFWKSIKKGIEKKINSTNKDTWRKTSLFGSYVSIEKINK